MFFSIVFSVMTREQLFLAFAVFMMHTICIGLPISYGKLK